MLYSSSRGHDQLDKVSVVTALCIFLLPCVGSPLDIKLSSRYSATLFLARSHCQNNSACCFAVLLTKFTTFLLTKQAACIKTILSTCSCVICWTANNGSNLPESSTEYSSQSCRVFSPRPSRHPTVLPSASPSTAQPSVKLVVASAYCACTTVKQSVFDDRWPDKRYDYCATVCGCAATSNAVGASALDSNSSL